MKTKITIKSNSARFWEVDFARGLAILMMIVFHIVWDLKYFGYISINPYSGFWGYFQIATAGLFLLLVGVMLAYGAQKYASKYSIHFAKRAVFIFLAALLVSFVTFILFPSEFIYFGILHLIAVSIILSIPFAKHKIIPLILGLFFIVVPNFINLQSIGINWLVWAGFSTPFPTLDFEPLFPWFGAVLIGISLGNFIYSNKKAVIRIKQPKGKYVRIIISKIELFGRNSLAIYLIHQPVIFSLVFLASLLFKM